MKRYTVYWSGAGEYAPWDYDTIVILKRVTGWTPHRRVDTVNLISIKQAEKLGRVWIQR